MTTATAIPKLTAVDADPTPPEAPGSPRARPAFPDARPDARSGTC